MGLRIPRRFFTGLVLCATVQFCVSPSQLTEPVRRERGDPSCANLGVPLPWRCLFTREAPARVLLTVEYNIECPLVFFHVPICKGSPSSVAYMPRCIGSHNHSEDCKIKGLAHIFGPGARRISFRCLDQQALHPSRPKLRYLAGQGLPSTLSSTLRGYEWLCGTSYSSPRAWSRKMYHVKR